MNYKVGDSIKEAAPGSVVYKKREENLEEYNLGAKKKKGKSGKKESTPPTVTEKENVPKEEKQKKTKYKPLYRQDGKTNDTVQLPGRHACECQAAKHKLINNCTSCGRIVCAQEGSGPCFFCSNLVCSKEEQEILNRQNKKSEQLLKKLTSDEQRSKYKTSKTVEEEKQDRAIANKNRLLDYDANCEKRTKVIDDESDYFNIDVNKWLTKEQRQALEKKKQEVHAEKHKSRLENKKLLFDFAGRRIIEDTSVPVYDIEKDDVMMSLFKDDAFSVEAEVRQRKRDRQAKGLTDLKDPTLNIEHLTYDENLNYQGKLSQKNTSSNVRLSKVQDSNLQEITDQGICLSMHQPWASLLVIGVKLHEGRTWYSSHRGKLWIHAASKVPTEQEVEQLQTFYELHSGVKAYQFPPYYPTSCLVGCVDVIDVLPQEEYREAYPDGESASPYVFVCHNPQELLIKFPMSGKHKLFQLDSKILQAAQKTIKKRPDERGTGVPGQ